MSYRLGMPLQRALLVFFAVMLVSAAVASLVRTPPLPTGTDATAPTPTEETPTRPVKPRTHDTAEARIEGADAVDLKVGDTPGASTFPVDRHLILTVSSRKPGEVAVSGLGLVATVVPGTPVVFDLFTSRPGKFPVEFTGVTGGPEVLVGTLVVEKAGPSEKRAGD